MAPATNSPTDDAVLGLSQSEIELRQCFRAQKRLECFVFVAKLAHYVGYATADACLGELGETLLTVLTENEEELVPMALSALESLLLTAYGSVVGMQIEMQLDRMMNRLLRSKRKRDTPEVAGVMSRLAHLNTALKVRRQEQCNEAAEFGQKQAEKVHKGITSVRGYVAAVLQEACVRCAKFRQTFTRKGAIDSYALTFKQAGVRPMSFLSDVHSSYRFTL
jgi:hypothetical protein